MKKIIPLIIVILAAAAIIIIGIRFLSGEDNWICQNGQWVKHGKPSAPMPTEGCGVPANTNTTLPTNGNIIVYSPQMGQAVKSPITLEGQAKGFWYFEASFPVKLFDENGKEIGATAVQAQGDWMTENFVRFKGELSYNSIATTTGMLVFERDNPSGLPQNIEEYRVPVFIYPNEVMSVKVYFNNDKLDPEYSCNKVFPVERIIPKTQAVARAALEELLKGPTEQEKQEGFITNINQGVVIQSLTIDPPTGGGIAKVDFNEQLEYQVGGSCRVAAIHAQIVETLKQFPTVQEVIVSINGRTEDILQP